MADHAAFRDLSPTTLAEAVGRAQVMDLDISPLWGPAPRIAGPAFTVRCPAGDQLGLHAAIYRAEPGSVLVVEAADARFALAGGNVCAIAQRRGIAGFVMNGAIRDVAEVRASGFPVYAKGVVPIPGDKRTVEPFNEPVRVGGVIVHAGDIVVADEEGIVVVPQGRADEVLTTARAKAAKEAALTLDAWEADHRARIDDSLKAAGFEG
ncbi:RraA family protein [Streptomyces sp. TRM66268-LWL]|uniref:Putative 4-hydroxy-4-methyl-2-oxoglutarate aldolase n=1 Tax=Streptomyces polyasparticus TaxID=2767826 RepID=A0ABR7SDY3_9ACTN|nr:RraA family protein [Streptomyces polyasparticus]MBC9713189.1 RraA family protein [Streptomyces polyasparticus]